MIDDYRHFLLHAPEADKFEAYKQYTAQYPAFFDAVFKYLYRSPIDTLREYIRKVDFHALVHRAERNAHQGMCDYIISAAEKTARLLQVDFEFELLLGMELSNIGGCSVPREDRVPYLYIGIDRDLTHEAVDIFVPHEMYHMIHGQMAPQVRKETLLSRAAEEGLASFMPMQVYHMAWNADTVAKLLSVQPRQAAYLLAHTGQIVDKAIGRGHEPLTPHIMQEYFAMPDANAEIALPGYYVGLYFTYLAVKAGVDLTRFTSMPNDEIADLWLKQYSHWK